MGAPWDTVERLSLVTAPPSTGPLIDLTVTYQRGDLPIDITAVARRIYDIPAGLLEQAAEPITLLRPFPDDDVLYASTSATGGALVGQRARILIADRAA